MDSYLEIAADVLRLVRRPLNAHQILRTAYENGLAPSHLRGRTQHKTLGARLSEDVLRLREKSRFYRTAPGRFLLRELVDDVAIPEDVRQPIVARRRRRELPQKRSLAFDRASLDAISNGQGVINNAEIFSLIDQGCYHYATSEKKLQSDSDVVLWSFMLVVRAGFVLSYRQGHYRDDRDTFMHRRTIGFYTPIIDDDLNLFDQADHGIISSGVKTLAMDLDLQDRHLLPTLNEFSRFRTFVYPNQQRNNDLLAVVSFACPDWLDPTSKRLAINDLEWLDLRSPPNHLDDFDPWSRAVLYEARHLTLDSA